MHIGAAILHGQVFLIDCMISLFVLFTDICSFALQEHLPLKCINHGQKTRGWLENVWGKNAEFRDLVTRSMLSPLITTSYRFINRNVVSAFVERWQPETNTFHMPYSEMTITLDDVGAILVIPVTGNSVSTDSLSVEREMSPVSSALGVSPEDAHN